LCGVAAHEWRQIQSGEAITVAQAQAKSSPAPSPNVLAEGRVAVPVGAGGEVGVPDGARGEVGVPDGVSVAVFRDVPPSLSPQPPTASAPATAATPVRNWRRDSSPSSPGGFEAIGVSVRAGVFRLRRFTLCSSGWWGGDRLR
jgi:hypothetical protein